MNKESKELILKFLSRLTCDINKAVEEICALPETVNSNCTTDEPARDWVILSIKAIKNGIVSNWSLDSDGLYRSRSVIVTCAKSLQVILDWIEQGAYAIHSVSRLSDNSVWTVGDEVYVNHYGKGLVQGFKIDEQTGIMLANLNIGYTSIERLCKSPLFHMTADGILVAKDQKLYSFQPNGDIQTHSNWEDATDKYSSEHEAKMAHKKWFYDQPVLSLFDLLNAGYDIHNVKGLAQYKLTQR